MCATSLAVPRSISASVGSGALYSRMSPGRRSSGKIIVCRRVFGHGRVAPPSHARPAVAAGDKSVYAGIVAREFALARAPLVGRVNMRQQLVFTHGAQLEIDIHQHKGDVAHTHRGILGRGDGVAAINTSRKV